MFKRGGKASESEATSPKPVTAAAPVDFDVKPVKSAPSDADSKPAAPMVDEAKDTKGR